MLLDLVKRKLVKIYSDYQNENTDEWKNFIFDHKSLLIENSTKIYIDPEIMFKYKYRLKEYLSSIDIDESLSWIIMYLNNIPSIEYFVDIDFLYIPSTDYLNHLKNNFNTYIIQNKK